MKTLQNNFTTPEQSKRLLELGVPKDSANCYLTRFGIDEDWEVKVLHNIKYSELEIGNQNYCLPCWSVGRLMEIYCLIRTYKADGFCFHKQSMECMVEYIVALFDENQDRIDFSKLEE